LLSIKDSYLKERVKTEAENVDDEGKEQKPKSDSNVITEEDMVEIQLLDNFLTTHQRKFDEKKAYWNMFIQRAKEENREKLESLKE
jgi:hypothetical protein